jgi:hypothetical protein
VAWTSLALILVLIPVTLAADPSTVLPPCEPVDPEMCEKLAEMLRSAKESDKALQLNLLRFGGGGSVQNRETMFEPTEEKNNQLYAAKLACDGAVQQPSPTTIKRFWDAFGEAVGHLDWYACDSQVTPAAPAPTPQPRAPGPPTTPALAEAAPTLPAEMTLPQPSAAPRPPPQPQPTASCRPFTALDEVRLEMKGLPMVTLLWDTAGNHGFFHSYKDKKAPPVSISGQGQLEIATTDLGRYEEMRANSSKYALSSGGTVAGWTASSHYLRRGESKFDLERLLGVEVANAYFISQPGFLVTETTNFSANAVEIRTWSADTACLAR